MLRRLFCNAIVMYTDVLDYDVTTVYAVSLLLCTVLCCVVTRSPALTHMHSCGNTSVNVKGLGISGWFEFVVLSSLMRPLHLCALVGALTALPGYLKCARIGTASHGD